MIKKLLVVSFLLCASQQTSFAQDAAEQKLPALEIKEHITGLDIEAHFDAIEKLYTGAKPDMDAIGKFVEDYPLDGFVLTENVLTNRGTRTPETIVREKDSFIKEEKERVYELLNTRIRHTITDIAYMDDNLSASVTYTSLFQGTLKKDTQTYGIATMGFKSLSVCTNILKLVNGQIKGVKADCKTEIIYDDPVPVN